MLLPSKVYLNGADCFHLMLERNIAKHPAGNNIIRMVVTLKSESTLKQIKDTLENSPLMIWIANIQLKTPFFLRPYWSFKTNNQRIKINKIEGIQSEIPEAVIYDNFDIKKDQLVRFHSYTNDNNELKLVMSFHHIILDGRGSGLIIRHLTGNFPIDETNLHEVFPKLTKKVGFFNHVVNMFQVKHFVESTMKKPVSFHLHAPKTGGKFKFHTHSFTLDETNAIDKNATQSGSRLGANLFQIACTAHCVQKINNLNAPIWIPIPYDGRKRGSNGPIISNNISFLFYRLIIDESTTVKETVNSIQTQMADQLRIEMPKKHVQLLEFMKFIPKRFYYWMTTYAGRGEIATFLYSSAGESLWDTSRFSDELSDTLLIPPFTYPPGLSVTFLRYDGKLKMNIVASEDKIDLNTLYLLEENLKALLLQPND